MKHSSPAPAKTFTPRRTAAVIQFLIGLGLFVLLMGAVVFLVIYPLWYLATQQKEFYTSAVLLGIVVFLLLLFALRLRRAVLNSRLDDFILKLLKFFAVVFFLSVQFVWALGNIILFGVLRAPELNSPGALILGAAVIAMGLGSLELSLRAGSAGLFGRIGRITGLILVALQAAYWAAVFIVQGLFLYTIVMGASILSFFFLKKLTKIVREKKKPNAEAVLP